MRIGVMSDSHGSSRYVDRAVELAGEVDMWLHCGDIVEDAEYLKNSSGVPVAAVLGNNDLFADGLPKEDVLEIEGHRILITHGHYYGVRYDVEELVESAIAQGCDIAIYGHTHVVYKRKHKGVTVINPGSVALPRDSMSPSFMVMDLEEDAEPKFRLIRFKRLSGSFFG